MVPSGCGVAGNVLFSPVSLFTTVTSTLSVGSDCLYETVAVSGVVFVTSTVSGWATTDGQRR